MKIVVNFDPETKECKIEWEVDNKDDMPLWDTLPFVYDALYNENRKEMKKNMLR